MTDVRKLTPEEDAEMRRLHYFQELGCELAPPLAETKDTIRSLDRRDEIRAPRDEVEIVPGGAQAEVPDLPEQAAPAGG